MLNKVINIDKEILSGTPEFKNTRVPIRNLFDYLETGETIERFLEDFDSVKKEQVLTILSISEKLIENTEQIIDENFA